MNEDQDATKFAGYAYTPFCDADGLSGQDCHASHLCLEHFMKNYGSDNYGTYDNFIAITEHAFTLPKLSKKTQSFHF